MHYILIGNPGVGKSTILNGFVGKAEFENGPSFGGGKTKFTETKKHNGDLYTDTPGLADVKMREQAAAEISKGLKKGGKFKVIFVLQPNEGRTRPDDITTMRLVLQSAPITSYGIVLNKIEDEIYGMMKDNTDDAMTLTMASFSSLDPKSPYIHLMRRQNNIAGKRDCVPEFDDELRAFFNSLPCINIPTAKVKDIEYSQFDVMFEKLEAALTLLREDKKHLEEQMKKDKEEWEEKLREMQERNEELESKMNDSSPKTVFDWLGRAVGLW